MGAVPVAMSLISTSISPVAMLGIPAEMYFYGLAFIMIQLGLLFTVLLTNHIYMPMFYKLNVTSAFQYLELRFNRTLRTICSVSSALQMIVYMSIVLYGPALALQQVTGVNLWLSVVSIGVVCTFYTTVVSNAVLTRYHAHAKRYQFLFRPDPTVRHSVWSLVIGGTFLWLTMYAVNQGWVQRYLSMPDVATVRRAMWMNLLGVIALQSALCYVGLVIFTRYNDCDPVSTRQVAAADQAPLTAENQRGRTKEIRQRIKEAEEEKWRQAQVNKSSLLLYRQHKDTIAPVQLYDNGLGSVLLFEARAGALRTLVRKQAYTTVNS
ncbi:hypothetical protein HPB51_026117 [Rhipicephalus microplus]|uniref:Transmembrane protein n=1 Tax=Rhipicephalus microplus TaxID=6941 RepID=A0A9J6FA40_RHIMP|nr:hypothetical protein HPB51_026117 [Rhipicephalus microplus]